MIQTLQLSEERLQSPSGSPLPGGPPGHSHQHFPQHQDPHRKAKSFHPPQDRALERHPLSRGRHRQRLLDGVHHDREVLRRVPASAVPGQGEGEGPLLHTAAVHSPCSRGGPRPQPPEGSRLITGRSYRYSIMEYDVIFFHCF